MSSHHASHRLLPAWAPRVLRCPWCSGDLHCNGAAVRCSRGHGFDVARHGYLNLSPSRPRAIPGDSADMLAARRRALRSGLFDPLVAKLVGLSRELCPERHGSLLVDVGAGDGHYAAALLAADPTRRVLALDLSVAAARLAARRDPARLAAIVTDVERQQVVRPHAVALALSCFAPRPPAAIQRMLSRRGRLITASAGGDHLRELLGAVNVVRVDPDKEVRLAARLGSHFRRVATWSWHERVSLDPRQAADLLRMGPAARHLPPEAFSSRALDRVAKVTLHVNVAVWRPADAIREGRLAVLDAVADAAPPAVTEKRNAGGGRPPSTDPAGGTRDGTRLG